MADYRSPRRPRVRTARVPERAFLKPGVTDRVVRYQFIYSMADLVFGLAFALLGVVLFLHGIAGATGWVVQLFGLKSSLSDAAPGAILFVVGLVVVFVTRYDVRPA